MNYIKNVIDKKFTDETIDFLLKNSSPGSIINSVIKLRKKNYIITTLGEWKFNYINDEVGDN